MCERKMEESMPESDEPKGVLVRVYDKSGKEFVCPLSALKEPGSVTEEELRHCFDSAEGAFSDSEIMAIIRSDLHKE